MHPILLQLGPVTLYSYGLFLALGFITAVWFSKRNASFYDIKSDDISDLFFLILVSAIVGARLLYVLVNFKAFTPAPMDIFKIWEGGLVFFGGFIGATLSALVYLHRRGLPVFKVGDIIAPGIALGHSIGRLGCFFAGCCFGKSCELPIAVTFTNPDSLAPLNVALHPTQLYMVVSNFILFLILVWLQRRKRFGGMVFLSYVMLYSLFRSIIEFFRGDFRGDFFFDFISLSQGIGLVVSGLALIVMIRLYRKSHDRS